MDTLDGAKLTSSVETALQLHPTLTKYTIAVPFDLTGPTGRGRKSLSEKWEGLADKWSATVKKKKHRKVSFELWPRFELIGRLVRQDQTGGLRRFWFDQTRFATQWFDQQIRAETKNAGPRYNPELTIEVPLSSVIDQFGETPGWRESRRQKIRELDKIIDHFRSRVKTRQKDESGDVGTLLGTALEASGTARELIARASNSSDGFSDVRPALAKAIDAVRIANSALRQELQTKYGSNAPESASFRQFQAEYMVQFPAEDYDLSRDLLNQLDEFAREFEGAVAAAQEARVLLVTGMPGTGKTHSVCDAALGRLAKGLLSVVILCEGFDASDVLDQARRRLGLPGTVGHDELLATLDAAALASGAPLIVFLDGLNDRTPRDSWKRDLAGLVERFKPYRNLRLCLTCRTTFLDAVLNQGEEIPRFEHEGFAGLEFEATFEFFRFWELDAPSTPMLQPEFANPLFLHLLCRGLKDSGRKRLERPPSLREVVDLFVQGMEKRAEGKIDVDPRDGYVQCGINALLEKMRAEKQFRLRWDDATATLETVLPGRPNSMSLRDFFLREGLLTEFQTNDAVPALYIRFGFERLGEFLFVERALADVKKADSLPSGDEVLTVLGTTAERLADRDNGLLEALAVLAPSQLGVELADLGLALPTKAISLAVARSLAWRDPATFTPRLQTLVESGLYADTFSEILGHILGLVGRPDHPLGAGYFDRLMRSIGRVQRDVVMCGFLYRDWKDKGPASRLIRGAQRTDLGPQSPAVAADWSRSLGWFCLATDRRVRDEATMGMANLVAGTPDIAPDLVTWAITIDDEYVLERALLATYGALIRTQNSGSVAATATAVWRGIFEPGPPTNAMIRDHARSIIELASARAILPSEIDITRCRPPYGSALPPELRRVTPFDGRQGGYTSRIESGRAEQALPGEGPAIASARHSTTDDDFAVYTMSDALNADDRSTLDFDACKVWILEELGRMGLSQRMDNYDGWMLQEHGGGRGKPDWAERIGKKYQWIALYRLVGMVEDNVPVDPNEWDKELPRDLPPALQAPRERNLDPTFSKRRAAEAAETAWWSPVSTDFDETASTSAWLDALAFPDSVRLIELADPNGVAWVPLQTYAQWDSRTDKSDWSQPYRSSFMQVRSYLVASQAADAFWAWLENKNLEGRRQLPEGAPDFPSTFLGEYPWSPTALRHLALIQVEREPFAFPVRPAANDLGVQLGFDSYHDEATYLLVPDTTFFDGTALTYVSDAGYESDGVLVLQWPQVRNPGPRALLARRDWLETFLRQRDLVLVWTVLSELQPNTPISGPREAVGYAVHSRAHILRSGRVTSTTGVTLRRTPAKTQGVKTRRTNARQSAR